MSTRLVYGPVASRRLGRSLGVDLVPLKTCSYDCIYCQLGRTTHKTIERAEYVPSADVMAQLERQLARSQDAEFVSFAGSGEPTLHSGIGALIRAAKRLTSIPVAVLTNGSLLWQPEVRDDLLAADLVLPSLDAGDEHLFACVNRPHPGVAFGRMVDGLARFREEFSGAIWLEVLLLGGITSTSDAAQRIAEIARGLRPQRIQLNTASRPTAEEHAYRVAADRMQQLVALFGPGSEVISDREPSPAEARAATDEDILALLARRPSTSEGVARGLGLHATEAGKRLAALCERRAVTFSRESGEIFYGVAKRPRDSRAGDSS